jgi:hypothetical protein
MAKSAAERRGPARIGSERQLQLRVAIIGAVAALLGSLSGGLITYRISIHEENANREEDRRIERRDVFLGSRSGSILRRARIFLVNCVSDT